MKLSLTLILTGLFCLSGKGQEKSQISESYLINTDSVIVSNNINFITDNELVLIRLKTYFGELSDYYSERQHGIICQVPTQAFGHFLLNYNLEKISLKIDKLKIKKYAKNILYKNAEVWKRIDDKPTRIYYDPINPRDLLIFLDYIIDNEIDSTNYVWILESPYHHPEDNYNGFYCKFTTSHSNPKWDWEYIAEKKDFCKVSERYKEEPIEWIPLFEGKEIKGDRITLVAKKIFIDEKMKELAKALKKACEIAIEFNLEFSKDNDG